MPTGTEITSQETMELIGPVKLAIQVQDREKKGLDPPLKNLALAILIQAIRDFFAAQRSGKNNEKRSWQEDAKEWFFSEGEDPGSFYWVCEFLEFHPRQILELLVTYQNTNSIHQEEWGKRLSRFHV
jgi:hypothetical protein